VGSIGISWDYMGVNESTHRLRGFVQSRLARGKLKESLRLLALPARAKAAVGQTIGAHYLRPCRRLQLRIHRALRAPLPQRGSKQLCEVSKLICAELANTDCRQDLFS